MLFIPVVSCGQIHSRLDLQKYFIVNLNESICINEKNCFYFNTDSSVSYLEMYYAAVNESKEFIDSVEFSPYKSRIYSFESQKESVYVVLWEIKYEYFPILIAYYVADGKLVRMGELNISLPCQSCEGFEYPIKDIQIIEKKDRIEISFLKSVNYREIDTQQWKEYKQGTLMFYFNILSKEFKANSDI